MGADLQQKNSNILEHVTIRSRRIIQMMSKNVCKETWFLIFVFNFLLFYWFTLLVGGKTLFISPVNWKQSLKNQITSTWIYDQDKTITIQCKKNYRKFLSSLRLLSVWQKPGTTTKLIMVVILPPSGINAGYFNERIIEDGISHKTTIYCQNPLMDISVLLKKGFTKYDSSLTDFHDELFGFEAPLKHLRDSVKDMLLSVTRIGLIFLFSRTLKASQI